MTPGEFKEIAKSMREFGVARVRMAGVDIELMPQAGGIIGNAVLPTAKIDPALPAEATSPIEHKVEQLASLMKLSDTELVDELFPDHTQQDESA